MLQVTSFLILLNWIWAEENIYLLVFGYGLTAYVVSQIAFLAHDALHGSISKKKWVNDIFGHLGMTIIAGMGYTEWKDRHLKHHRYCQDENVDPDMQTAHIASVSKSSFSKKSKVFKSIGKFQVYYIWLLTLLFGHSQRHVSQACVLLDLKKYIWDVPFLIIHFSLWWIMPVYFLNIAISSVALAYFIPASFLGIQLASVFWGNHVGMPLVKDQSKFSFVEHQIRTSRNIENPRFLDSYYGGLNFQIEHHVLPNCPSVKLRELQRVFRPIVQKSKLNYESLEWLEAFKVVKNHFKEVSQL
jgi:fatty acid desaturase